MVSLVLLLITQRTIRSGDIAFSVCFVEWFHMEAQSHWDIASVSWDKKDKQRTTAISAALHTYPHPACSHMCIRTPHLDVNSYFEDCIEPAELPDWRGLHFWEYSIDSTATTFESKTNSIWTQVWSSHPLTSSTLIIEVDYILVPCCSPPVYDGTMPSRRTQNTDFTHGYNFHSRSKRLKITKATPERVN